MSLVCIRLHCFFAPSLSLLVNKYLYTKHWIDLAFEQLSPYLTQAHRSIHYSLEICIAFTSISRFSAVVSCDLCIASCIVIPFLASHKHGRISFVSIYNISNSTESIFFHSSRDRFNMVCKVRESECVSSNSSVQRVSETVLTCGQVSDTMEFRDTHLQC